MKMSTKTRWAGLLLIFWLVSCSQQAEPVLSTETPAPLIETNTPFVQPTDTSQPGLVILVAPENVNLDRVAEVVAQVEQSAAARGYRFEIRRDLTPENIPAGLKLVVALSTVDGMSELAAALPQVQFVLIGGDSPGPSTNLTIMEGSDSLPELAFMAGYIAAVQAEEYRIGIISVADEAGQTFRDAFLNGVHYFCGICNPVFPPFEPYPLYAEVGANAGEVEVQQAADVLISRSVDMVHVAPALQSESIYQYLVQNDIRIVGTDAPPAGLETHWVASVIPASQMTLGSVLDSALNGQALGIVSISLQVNFTGVGDARLAHFSEIISKLDSGEIDPVGLVD
jgi:hypothetical protein